MSRLAEGQRLTFSYSRRPETGERIRSTTQSLRRSPFHPPAMWGNGRCGWSPLIFLPQAQVANETSGSGGAGERIRWDEYGLAAPHAGKGRASLLPCVRDPRGLGCREPQSFMKTPQNLKKGAESHRKENHHGNNMDSAPQKNEGRRLLASADLYHQRRANVARIAQTRNKREMSGLRNRGAGVAQTAQFRALS